MMRHDVTASCSFIDDERVRVLVSHLLDNRVLLHLNLAHNKIGDA